MNRFLGVALCAAVPALWVGGCKDFLSGDKLTTDPNRPTAASADQLFVGVQVATFAMFETTPALLTEVWTQQLSGVARQFINFADYNNTEFDPDGIFQQVYGGGGLVDIRRIEASARGSGNDKLLGIAEVYEALVVGTAADWWGDIPYTDAVSASPTPKLDAQASVYAAVQQVLDSAIAHLATGKGFGPGTTDFVYGRDAQKWTRAAHTLKARYYLHVSRGADSIAMFNKAKAEALLGINSPAGDFRTLHSSAAGETNLFFEFFANTRAGDIDPGGTLIGLLTGAASPNNVLPPDPRLAGSEGYFVPNSTGNFVGALPDKTVAGISGFNITASTSTPIITSAENQM